MEKEYDISISYRRDEQGRVGANIPIARAIESCFYKIDKDYEVFLDMEECNDGKFQDVILPAIRTCGYFLLLLTKDALDRCQNEGDWVRKEIEEAIKYNRKIVLVTPDGAMSVCPFGLPESIRSIDGIEITDIGVKRKTFKSEMQYLVEKRLGPPMKKNDDVQRGAEVHVGTDWDCHVIRYKQELMLAKKEEDNILYLQRGNHKLDFVADGCEDIKASEIVKIPDLNYFDYVEVKLRDRVLSRIEQKENEERERKAREEQERKERERREREERGMFTVGGVEFKMVKVEGGTFTMGATAEQGIYVYNNEKPSHKVTLGDYYIGETQVTQALWKAVMGENPSHFKGDDSLPVERVSWENIVNKFIPKLNKQTGRTFRLPTEAEWEYAARGGNKSKGYKYSGSNNIDEVAWYSGNSGDNIHPVKGKKANELGLYDMCGNVLEWCNDWEGDYSGAAQTNPKGPEKGTGRVLRGGSWVDLARDCRVSPRHSRTPGSRYGYIGFRLVMCP